MVSTRSPARFVMIQNHMLQVVGFLAMESPPTTNQEAIRNEQVKVFRMIRPLSAEDLVRGQFRGYRQEDGVARDSMVETFAAARLRIDSPRWGPSETEKLTAEISGCKSPVWAIRAMI